MLRAKQDSSKAKRTAGKYNLCIFVTPSENMNQVCICMLFETIDVKKRNFKLHKN